METRGVDQATVRLKGKHDFLESDSLPQAEPARVLIDQAQRDASMDEALLDEARTKLALLKAGSREEDITEARCGAMPPTKGAQSLTTATHSAMHKTKSRELASGGIIGQS